MSLNTWISRSNSADRLSVHYPLHSPSDTGRQGCTVCLRSDCNLPSHHQYTREQLNARGRRPDNSALIGTSFAHSYAFNPLAVAVHYVRGQTELYSYPEVLSDNLRLSHCLHNFVKHEITLNVPFVDPSGSCDVASQWLMTAAVDELACTSTLLLWTIIELRKAKDSQLDQFATKLTAFFLEELRKRVENGETVSPGTIFAASNHLSIVSMYLQQTVEQREVMMRGLEAMVNQAGGIKHVADTQKGLLQSLLWSDMLHAWNTGYTPRFQLKRPRRPTSYTMTAELRGCSYISPSYFQCCCPGLMDSAKHLRLFLLFRHSTAVRALTKVEYCYMVDLERYIHVQMLEQQARYHHTNSISECIILAMAIVRMSVLCIWDQHSQVRQSLVGRLDHALKAVPSETWSKNVTIYPLIWICWVILTQAESCYDQNMVLQLISMPLRIILGYNHRNWPPTWSEGFSTSFMPLMWHSDYNTSVRRIATLIEDFLSRRDSSDELYEVEEKIYSGFVISSDTQEDDSQG